MKRLMFALAMLAAGAASAQAFKPGLWELTNKVKTGNAQTDQGISKMLEQMANLPPEQRAQMEAMMKQNGVSMPKAGSDGSMVITGCITPEMAARKEPPLGQKGKCTSKTDQVAGGMNLSFSCTDPSSSGQGTLRFNGDSSYVMNMTIHSGEPGLPRTMQMESTGRWLSATCPAKPN